MSVKRCWWTHKGLLESRCAEWCFDLRTLSLSFQKEGPAIESSQHHSSTEWWLYRFKISEISLTCRTTTEGPEVAYLKTVRFSAMVSLK